MKKNRQTRVRMRTVTALSALVIAFIQPAFSLPTVHAQSALHIVTRAEWGADESYRFWAPDYRPVQKFIIHHTVTNTSSDYAAIVRSIYYYHAQSLGWGDIGYNFLIDPNGIVYEGRYGGDGVVGAHAYNDRTKTNYNYGSIGIALLGNFETNTPTAQALASLEELIAEKSQLHNIQPGGSGIFLGSDIPNIVGHRDVDATACPGGNLYADLSTIRTEAQNKLAALPPLPPVTFIATLTPPPTNEIVVESGTTATVTASVTNTGTAQWQSYIGSRRVTIIPVGTSDAAKLVDTSWASAQEVGDGGAANVVPNGSAQLSFQIKAPTDSQLVNAVFALRSPDGVELANTRFSVTMRVTNLDYSAKLEVQKIPVASFLGTTKTAVVRVTNIGVKTWQSGDVRLRISASDGQASAYRATSWKETEGNFPLDQASLAPGQTGTYTVTFQTPKKPGLYEQRYVLTRADGSAIAVTPLLATSRADSMWQAVKKTTAVPLAMKKSTTRKVTVVFTNVGATTWSRTMRLTVTNVDGKKSVFRSTSWASSTGSIAPKEVAIRPKGKATYAFSLQAPAKPGIYYTTVALGVRGNSSVIVSGGSLTFVTRVDK